MKDGTEITHYGVKGMKWGKRLFGKVRGVFGKPDNNKQPNIYRQDHLANLATDLHGSLKRRNGGVNPFDRSGVRKYQATRDMLQNRYSARYEADPIKKSSKLRDANIQANIVKKRSKRLNGR